MSCAKSELYMLHIYLYILYLVASFSSLFSSSTSSSSFIYMNNLQVSSRVCVSVVFWHPRTERRCPRTHIIYYKTWIEYYRAFCVSFCNLVSILSSSYRSLAPYTIFICSFDSLLITHELDTNAEVCCWTVVLCVQLISFLLVYIYPYFTPVSGAVVVAAAATSAASASI